MFKIKSYLNIFIYIYFIVLILILSYLFIKDYTEIKYLNISIIIFLISLISIIYFSHNEIKKYFIIIFSTILFSFYLFEINIMYNFIGFDHRQKNSSYFQLRKSIDDVRLFSLKHFKKHDIQTLSGIINSRTINCNEDGYYSIYHSDRFGFNNNDSEHDKKIVKYLLLGDSFAMSDCVNRPYDIASQLINYDSKKGVLSFGYPGTTILSQYATLREYLVPNIENVILFFYEGNDLFDLEKELTNPILLKYLEDLNFSQGLKNDQNKINDLMKTNFFNLVKKHEILKKRKIKNFFKLYETRRLFFGETRISQYKQQQGYNFMELIKFNKNKIKINELANHYNKILNLISDLLLKQNTKLFIAYLPQYERYSENYNNPSYEIIKDVAKKNNIKFIDFHKDIFSKEVDYSRLFPTIPGHYNEHGYKKISELIYRIVK